MSVRELVAAANAFGFALLERLWEEGENVFFSPASIAVALLMVANGADEATAAAIRRALRLAGLSLEGASQAQAELWPALIEEDEAVTLALANSVWVTDALPVAPSFRKRVLASYEAAVENIDFRQARAAAAAINRWVAAQTEGKIADLLAAADVAEAVMVLVNAIYFRGLWHAPFARMQTRPGPFTRANGSTLPLPMMSNSGPYHYLENDALQMLSLPFGSGRLSLVVLLPRPGRSLRQMRARLSADRWRAWMDALLPQPSRYGGWDASLLRRHQREGTVVLPRFCLSYRMSLLRHLRALGLDANRFTRIAAGGEPLLIDAVLHQSFLEVNEEGAEAAAATAVTVARSAMVAPRPFRIVVDRPFFCALRDNGSGALLFMGTVYQPEASR